MFSSLDIDTGFLGFFSGLIMTLTNGFERWFSAHQNCDNLVYSSMNFDFLSAERDKRDLRLVLTWT